MRKCIWFLLLLVLAFSFFGGEGAYGENDRVAILYASPKRRKGIEVLPPNAIPNYFAVYRIGRKFFKVVYTEHSIVLPGYWKKKRCSGVPLFVDLGNRVSVGGFYSLFYRDGEAGYSLFFIFNSSGFNGISGSKVPGFEDRLICEFVTRFIKEFKFFMQFRRYKTDIPFPAVIELGG